MIVKPNGKVDFTEIDRKSGKDLTGEIKEGWPIDVRQGIASGDARPLELDAVAEEVVDSDPPIEGNDPDMTANAEKPKAKKKPKAKE